MKLSIILFACLAFVAAEPYLKREGIKADKDFLVKQKFFLEILHNIIDPLKFEEYLKDSHKFIEDKSAYLKYDEVEDFFKYWNHNLYLPRGHIFSIFNEEHRDQAIALFDLFYYSKDWTTFYKNVCWARVHMNEGMFVYALTLTVLHHKDYVGIVLPAPYEILPNMFFNGQVITDAKEFRMNYLQDKTILEKDYPPNMWPEKYIKDHETSKNNEFFKNFKMWYTWSNYTQEYYTMNQESKLDYFREDLGWNSFYYYYHMDYPFWMNSKDFGLTKDYRGELFFHMHQQLLARYYLERLSQKLGDIPEFSYNEPIKYGYNPHMMYSNGQGFTTRRNYYEVYDTKSWTDIQMVVDYENRFRNIIDRGFYQTHDGIKIDLRTDEGMEYLGNLIECNGDSVDTRFFGYWRLLSHMILGGAHDIHFNNYKFIVPSIMEHFETAMRDPVFYMLYKRLVKVYVKFQNLLPEYKHEELMFKGVEISNVKIDKIQTYFEHFDADLTTLMGHDWMFNEPNKMFKARQWRLNFKPFNVNMEVNSDKAQKVMIKIFLGPKYDEYGNLYTLNENRENFYEIEQFLYDLPSGKSIIKHSSADFYWSVKDRTTYTELYQRVMMAIDGKMDFELDMSEAHCGFPERLLIPRGWVKGMPVQFFFIIMPFQDVKQYESYNQQITCGIGSGDRYMDNRPFNYPFDREIIFESDFLVPNMQLEDGMIYHMKYYDDFEAQIMPQYYQELPKYV